MISAARCERDCVARATSPEPRPEVHRLAAAVHGGADREELARYGFGGGPENILDFSTNINPYGPAPAVRQAVAAVPIDHYPDPDARVFRTALAQQLRLCPNQIRAGNGCSELIWLAALAFVRPGDSVVIVGPTYAEYARAAALMSASVRIFQARAEDGFAVDGSRFERMLSRARPRLVFICNPNNPTGVRISVDHIGRWVQENPATVFVIDEAYLPLAGEEHSAVQIGAANLLVLRSMTKELGLAGLRLGYAIGSEEMISWLKNVQPPWSVNALAQSAGLAALENIDYYRQQQPVIDRAKDKLMGDLASLGLASVASATPFFLVEVQDGSVWRHRLLQEGILVRACASFGLPAYVRLAARRPEENARLVTVLQKLVTAREANHAG